MENMQSHLVAEVKALQHDLRVEQDRNDLHSRLLLADEALLDALAAGGGLEDLSAGISRALGAQVRIFDLTVRHDVRGSASLSDAERQLLDAATRETNPQSSVNENGHPITAFSVKRGTEVVGALIVSSVLDAQTASVMRRCGRVVSTFITAQRRIRGDIAVRQRELLEYVLTPPVGGISKTMLRRLEEHGIVQGEPFRVLVGDGDRHTLSALDHRLEQDFGAGMLRAIIGNQLVSLVNEATFKLVRELFSGSNRGWEGLLIGHSPRLHRIEIVPPEMSLVERVVSAARSSAVRNSAARGSAARSGAVGGSAPQNEVLVSLESYGAIGAFLSRVNLEPTRMAVRETLGPILDYDSKHGTDLAETAYTFLFVGRSVPLVAEQMHLHPNTVRQRLDRIASLLGGDWSYGQAGLDHHIMLAAHRLLD